MGEIRNGGGGESAGVKRRGKEKKGLSFRKQKRGYTKPKEWRKGRILKMCKAGSGSAGKCRFFKIGKKC